jgi:NTE family protein
MPDPEPRAFRRPIAVMVAALTMWFAAAEVDAQQPAAPRPRIGLVLSGGGARGIAHAGILAVLEELRVPVDCVVGTSMGSIVGGLYAYGLSPDELQTMLVRKGVANDWPYLLLDGPRREDMVFRRKEDERNFQSRLRVGVHDGALAFPKGLLQGQNLEVELRLLTMAAHDLRSFDDLPLPFRCVAVDIATGEQVVLASGSLPDAMRASMSLPGVFAPTRIGNRLLLDGGLLNNVPVDVARALGVDVLIVVDIGTPLNQKPEINNLFDVTSQMVAILTEQNVRASRASLRPEDVIITPDLGTITSADFGRAAESIDIGRAAALGVADRLRKFSVSEAEYAAFLKKQRRVPAPMPQIRNLQVINDSGLGTPLLETRFGLRVGSVLNEDALRLGCEQLYATDDLERVAFSLSDWRDGAADLQLRIEEKSWGPSYLRFGLSLESNFQGDSQFNVSMQYTSRTMDSLGAEWRTKVQFGNDNLIESEYYQPLDAEGRWFVAPRVAGERRPATLYDQGQKVTELQVTDGTAGFDIGRQFGRWGELRVGVQWTLGDLDVISTLAPVPNQHFDDAVARVLLQVDTLDSPRFPHRGSLGKFEWRIGLPELGADVRYQQLHTEWTQAIPLGPDTTVLPRAVFVTPLADVTPAYAEPGIGGFLNLSGFARNAFRDQGTGLMSLIGYQRLAGSTGMFGVPVYVGGSIEAGEAWSSRAESMGVYRMAGSAFLGIDTPLGPSYLAYGQAEGGNRTLYFFLGQLF